MISIVVVNLYLIVFRVEINTPQLLFFDDTFMFAYGPLLYLFTQSVLFENYKLEKKHIIHFIPFLISICIVVYISLFVDSVLLSETTNRINSSQVPMYFHIGGVLLLIHIFFYLFWSKREVGTVIDIVKDFYSTFNQDNFRLLKFILNSFIALFILSLLHSILPFIGIDGGLLITLLLMILFMFYFINSILLKMLNLSSDIGTTITQLNFKEKYAGSSLSQTDLKVYMNKLANHMKKNERFLDSTINMRDLSAELDISSKVLSQVIIEGYDCNFFDFVNKYRIETAKLLLKNQTDDKSTIQEIMYDSGFNSKSSFNTAFKKITSLTPTQYKNSIQKSSTS